MKKLRDGYGYGYESSHEEMDFVTHLRRHASAGKLLAAVNMMTITCAARARQI